MSDNEFERLAVLHAVGALDGAEADRFQRARKARGQVGERLVGGVERALAGVGTAGVGTVPTERADLASVTEGARAWPRPGRWPIAAGLLALLLVLAIGSGLWIRGQNRSLTGDLGTALRAADSLNRTIAARDSADALRLRPEELATVLAGAELQTLALSGADPGVRGRLLISPEGGVLVAARGLPSPGVEGYRLWAVGPGGVREVADLGAAPNGVLLEPVPDTGFLQGARSVAVAATPPTADGEAPRAALQGPLR